MTQESLIVVRADGDGTARAAIYPDWADDSARCYTPTPASLNRLGECLNKNPQVRIRAAGYYPGYVAFVPR